MHLRILVVAALFAALGLSQAGAEDKKVKEALLVIDVQNEYFPGGKLPVTHPQGSFENILKAMDAATAAGVPVVVIQHSAPQPDAAAFRKGSEGWKLHPEIEKRKYDALIEKHLPGSFTGTNLEAWLKEHGIESVVIAGYMTQMCCDTTSRQAMHLGYKVKFLSDGTGTLAFKNDAGAVTAEELHRAILVAQAARFSKVMSTADWIASLSRK